jgi:hypothetical protein
VTHQDDAYLARRGPLDDLTPEQRERLLELFEVSERTGAPWWLLLEAQASVRMSRADDEGDGGTHAV